jgi:hypothetical protein
LACLLPGGSESLSSLLLSKKYTIKINRDITLQVNFYVNREVEYCVFRKIFGSKMNEVGEGL